MSESQGIYISIYSSGFPCSLGPKKSDRGSKRKGKNMTEISGDVKRQRQKKPQSRRDCISRWDGWGQGGVRKQQPQRRTYLEEEPPVWTRGPRFLLKRKWTAGCFLSPELSRGSNGPFIFFYPTGCVPDPTLGGPSDQWYITVSKKGKNAWTLFYRSDRCTPFFISNQRFLRPTAVTCHWDPHRAGPLVSGSELGPTETIYCFTERTIFCRVSHMNSGFDHIHRQVGPIFL
jgi:hypothetical protein